MFQFRFVLPLLYSVLMISCTTDKIAPPGTIVASAQAKPLSLALTHTDVYWANFGGLATGGWVGRAPKAGGQSVMLANNGERVSDITADDQHIYWVASTLNGSSARLLKMPLTGTVPTELATVPPTTVNLTVYGGNLYWTEPGVNGRIMRISIAGGTPVEVLTNQDGASYMTISNGYVYWTTEIGENGVINKASLANGQITVLATDQIESRYIQVEGDYVYWFSNANALDYKTGRINKISVQGGEIKVLASNQDTPRGLKIRDQTLYWMTFGDVQKMSSDGSNYKLLASGVNCPGDLEVDQSHVYWTNECGGDIRKTDR